ncbi:UMF1 family MFS transporter [Sphingopyxis panaciterrae]|uniref:MFS transporter n=1 Tax=Sphingopyxis panaciterrae TaxID=363841 RepID=UPI001422A404|nr:MFS transporter [Sphingopyxis panaciterrae]NIJ35944.1 UMF1 family MFS transporter [Sphingopyxis panaciterrae]
MTANDDTPEGRLPGSARAWAFYEGARTPYVILIKVYIFIPYLATVLVGDPVSGQALVARLVMAYGLFAALTAPLLGATMDRAGKRKPLLAAITAALVVCCASLWWATPAGLGLGLTCAIIFFAGILFAYSEVLHNSLLPFAAPPGHISATSGLGLALGSAISVVLLAFILWAFALPARMSADWLPDAPLFGLSAAAHQTDRIVGPIVALILGFGALPLFLWGRDAPRGAGGGIGESFAQLKMTLKSLPANRPMATFLASRMIYTDGLTAILLFMGIYAAGVMRWGALELTALAIIVSCFLAIGGLVGGRLDRLVGPRRAIRIELAIVVASQFALIGIAPDRLFYMAFNGSPLWDGPMFNTLPEIAFVVLASVSAVGICGCYASSRSMLTSLATPETVGSWFGLYALSGSVTIWLGSALVGLATAVWGTQQAGFVALIGLIALGWFGIGFVKKEPDPA